MTFATYVPANYSLDAFNAKRLDYDLHLTPVEIWGSQGSVLAAVATHNEITRRLAAENPNVLFVDQAKLMATGGRYFNDVCHLTVAGSLQFVNNMHDALGANR